MKLKNWAEDRKSVLLKELVHQMLLAKLFFDGFYENYKKSGQVSFQALRSWIGTETNKGSLWNLKDSSHLLFRNDISKQRFYENVFDWTLGSLFHETMKLKEDVYILEVYQKQGTVITDDKNIPGDVNIGELIEEYKIIIQRSNTSAQEEIENLRHLFSKAMDQLQKILLQNKQDGLLIRFLVESEDLFDRVYGQNALRNALESMYPQGLVDAYLRAGKNYRDGGWYNEASTILKRAQTLSPHNKEIKKEISLVQKKQATGE